MTNEQQEVAPTPWKDIQEMRKEYEKKIRAESTSRLQTEFPDRPSIEETQSTWVSYKEVQQLLTDNAGADGIRFYFGCHVKETNKDPKADYKGKLTVILVATKSSDSANPRSENSIDQLDPKATYNDKQKVPVYTKVGDDRIPLCPPNCN